MTLAPADVRWVGGWLLGSLGVVMLWLGWTLPGWVAWALAGFFLAAESRADSPEAIRVPRPWLGLGLIVLAGALLRMWNLADMPPGCWHDEAENGLETLRILAGEWFVFTPRNNGRGSLQFFWTAPFFKILGPQIAALRLGSAVIGILSVAALWGLLRSAGQARLALVSAGFLSLSFWHVLVSRLGFDAGMTLFFDILMVAAISLGYRQGRMAWFAAAGLLLAVANYGYAASRFSLLLAWAALMILKPRDWDSGKLRAAWLAAFAGLVLGLLPLLQIAWTQPEAFFQRPGQVSVLSKVVAEKSLKPWLRTLRSNLRMLYERGDANPRHHLPGKPMLDPITGVALLAGLAGAWRHRQDPWVRLMAAWLTISLLSGTLTEPAPHGLRTLSALVAVAFFAGRGLLAGIGRFAPSAGRVVAAIAMALLAVWTSVAYFGVYARTPAVWAEFSPQASLAGAYLRAWPGSKPAIISESLSPSVVKFTAHRPEIAFSSHPAGTMPAKPEAIYFFSCRDEVPGRLLPGLSLRMLQGKRGETLVVGEYHTNLRGPNP